MRWGLLVCDVTFSTISLATLVAPLVLSIVSCFERLCVRYFQHSTHTKNIAMRSAPEPRAVVVAAHSIFVALRHADNDNVEKMEVNVKMGMSGVDNGTKNTRSLIGVMMVRARCS